MPALSSKHYECRRNNNLEDPSIAWPPNPTKVELGTIETTEVITNIATSDRQLLSVPASLPAGIEVQDPMIKVRSAPLMQCRTVAGPKKD